MEKVIMLGTFLILSIGVFLYSCTNEKSEGKRNDGSKETKQEVLVEPKDSEDVKCDSTLWKHVWDPPRLQVIDMCKEVTGVIEETSAQDDGDGHMLLKLDAGQEDLLNKENKKEKNGDLVIEVICANEITKKKAKQPCEGYLNNVKIPQIGQHVKVTGSYVIDTNNGWTEIHPVTKIEVIK